MAPKKTEAVAEVADERWDALELRKLELEVAHMEFESRHDEYIEKTRFSEPQHHGEFTLTGNINELSVHGLIDRLEFYSKRYPKKPIILTINSAGGNVIDALALIDHLRLLRKRGHKVTTFGVGMVASAASAIMMAGDDRVMTSRCWMLLHEASMVVGGSLTLLDDATDFVKAMQEQLVDLYCERSNLNPRTLKARWKRKDIYLSATEAQKLGLIDRIEEA